MLLVSNKAVENIVTVGGAVARQDNMLKEWELAVDKLARDPLHIVPVLIGEHVEVSGRRLYEQFGAYGGLPNQPWPDTHSVTCKTRTIKRAQSTIW